MVDFSKGMNRTIADITEFSKKYEIIYLFLYSTSEFRLEFSKSRYDLYLEIYNIDKKLTILYYGYTESDVCEENIFYVKQGITNSLVGQHKYSKQHTLSISWNMN